MGRRARSLSSVGPHPDGGDWDPFGIEKKKQTTIWWIILLSSPLVIRRHEGTNAVLQAPDAAACRRPSGLGLSSSVERKNISGYSY